AFAVEDPRPEGAPVVKMARQVDERVERVQKSIRELMDMRKEQCARGLRLHDLLGGLPVYANVHMVTNQHGTTFMRAFYFLDGVMTPLNVIRAAVAAGCRALFPTGGT
ncbi:hypothetical protein AAIH59_33125, partial [Pseudomonas aeruginosa]